MAATAETTAPAKLTSADVRACIQRHFGTGGEQYAVLFEVRNGTAWRANRSVDAVVMSLWPSLGMELWGMEIKTARHDWQRELSNPGKASEVFDYFDRWFLVAPEGVAKHEELPAPWGWFVPKDGKLYKVRDAAKNQNVKAVDRHFLGALLRRVAKTDDAFVQSTIAEAIADERKHWAAESDRVALKKLGDLKRDAEQWVKLRDLLKEKPNDFLFQDDVIAAVRVLLKAGVAKSYSSLRSLSDEVARMHEALRGISDELGIKPRPARR